jgi:hypothetical protein
VGLPPVSEFLGQVTPWIAVTGIIALFVGGSPVWLGVALIVAGVAATRALQPESPATAST